MKRVLHGRLDMGCPARSPEGGDVGRCVCVAVRQADDEMWLFCLCWAVLLVWMCKEGQVKEDLLQKIFRNAKDELSQVGTYHLLQASFRLSTAAVSPNTGPFAAVLVQKYTQCNSKQCTYNIIDKLIILL